MTHSKDVQSGVKRPRLVRPRFAVMRFIAASRIVFFPLELRRLWSLGFMRSYFANATERDSFFFFTHEYYLSKSFRLAERVKCALNHYLFERQNYGANYHRSVYRTREGLMLWQRTVGAMRCCITLNATEDTRHEGDLSVLCVVNDVRVCRMAFSYVNGAVFGQAPCVTMFVTRNQTDRNAELQLFRDAFKQNSPPYFCIAAICGIAMANGMSRIYLVKDEAQIAYQRQYAQGFSNSYSSFWAALGAEQISTQQAFRMRIPMDLGPLSEVKQKHKTRAIARRKNWFDIISSTRQAMLSEKNRVGPAPIETQELERMLSRETPS